MSQLEMPIFTRTFDFITWLLPMTNHFPKAHRHTFTRRLLDAAFDLREHLEEANLRKQAFHVGVLRMGRCHQALRGSSGCGGTVTRMGTALFVDIRISRKVRAVGFLDAAFERTVGSSRYRWMPLLGN